MRKVRFWGTRGSIPVALNAHAVRRKVAAVLRAAQGKKLNSPLDIEQFLDALDFPLVGTYGGNSSCVEIESGKEYVLCDMGSGARAFAQEALQRHGAASPQIYHILISHLHTDHLVGFPFFTPAYLPGNKIHIYGCHPGLEAAVQGQMADPVFPVGFLTLPAQIEFHQLTPDETTVIAGIHVTPKLQDHGGDSYGYRFVQNGKTVVYSTDAEHRLENAKATATVVDFFRGADLVVFDSMYSLAEQMSVKADWGHSSNVVGVELCQMAGARHLALFHHEPSADDAAIHKVLLESRRLEEITRAGAALKVSAAYDGLEIVL